MNPRTVRRFALTVAVLVTTTAMACTWGPSPLSTAVVLLWLSSLGAVAFLWEDWT